MITGNDSFPRNRLYHAEFRLPLQQSDEKNSELLLSFGQLVLSFDKNQTCETRTQKQEGGKQVLTTIFPMAEVDNALIKKIKGASNEHSTFEIKQKTDIVLITVTYDPHQILCVCESFDTVDLRAQVQFTFYSQKVLNRLQHSVKPMIRTALFTINSIESIRWC